MTHNPADIRTSYHGQSASAPHFVQLFSVIDGYGKNQLLALDTDGFVWMQVFEPELDKSVWHKQALHWRIA